MLSKKRILTVLLLLIISPLFSQEAKGETMDKRFGVIFPWHNFLNWLGEDLEMYEFHLTYDLTPRDTIGIKAATWKLVKPMGIQLWEDDFMTKDGYFDGRVFEKGIGITYQRFLWKRLFASIEIMPMHKAFWDKDDKEVGQGFRLYTTYHLGYKFEFFNKRFFIEPQVHCNYWPINTSGPRGFKEKVDDYNNFFLFEPNVYFGVKF